MADPWAEFKPAEPEKATDPYAEFSAAPVDTSAPSVPMIGNHPAFGYYDQQHAQTQKENDGIAQGSSFGRVLDAFGQGVKDAWGEAPLGFSKETDAALRKAGVFHEPGRPDGITAPFRAFNEGLLRPVAATVDAGLRGIDALMVGTAAAAGQTADETGLSKVVGLPGSSLTRDVYMLSQTLGVVSGTGELRDYRPATATKGASLPDHVIEPARPGPDATQTFSSIASDEGLAKPAEISKPLPQTSAIDKAGNINLDRIAAPQDVKDVIREAAANNADFTDARRGQISLAETEQMANALGMTPEQLTKRNVGQAFNAEEAVAARNLLVQSATKVRELAAKAVGGTDQDVLAFQEAATKHVAIQEQVAGMTAEAGRALSAFRITAGEGGDAATAIKKVLDNFGGRADIEDIAKKIGELDTPQKVSKFLMDARKATVPDMLVEAWINGLLSGPQTHVTNALSNTLTALWSAPETAAAAVIGKARQVLGGAEGERVLMGEAGARLYGAMQGAKEGVIAGWKAFKTETPSDALQKVEAKKMQAIPSKTISVFGRQMEVGGKQVRIPGRLLMASDEVFKAIARRQELHAQAYRRAAQEGLNDSDFAARVADLVENPTPAMKEAADATAEYQTFQTPLGPTGQKLQEYVNSHRALKIIVPFIRTPVNILKYAAERSPLGLASKEIRDNLKGANGKIAQDTQAARLALGTSVGITAAALAANGFITGGGPTDPREKALMYASGWQPYSVRIGEHYYSFARLDPLASLLGVSADLHDIAEHVDDPSALVSSITASISKNLINKTWLQGPADLVQAIEDPDRYGQKYVQSLVGTIVPTGFAQVARTEDPVMRDVRSTIDAIKARVPGLSQTLLPRRDVWGEPIQYGGSVGPDLVSPIYESQIKNDPVTRAYLDAGLFPAKLQRKVEGVTLTPEQYDDYQRIGGRLLRQASSQVVAMPGFAGLPQETRREVLERVGIRARKAARANLMMLHPEIVKAATEHKLNLLTGSKSAQ